MAARLRSYTQADHAFSGSAGSRQADRDANVDRASKRRKIDGSNSPTGNGNNSTMYVYESKFIYLFSFKSPISPTIYG